MGCGSSKTIEITEAPTTNGTIESHDSEDEYVEDIVCKADDLKENEMKTFELFELDEGKVLLVKQRGKISAIGTKCTHYGAPLVSSALGDGRVRCQWHGACFSLATGDIEDFPGLDSLPCYQVTVENNNVKVRAKKSELEENIRKKPMAKKNKNRDAKHVVVIGGGPAGATCVEVLRQEGFQGQITLVCKENCLPYDRVKVSKAMDFDIEKAQFRTDEFYKEHGIDVLKNIAATSVDAKAKTVNLDNCTVLHYDKLFVATGVRARKLNIPGANLTNVVVLRDYAHSEYTNAQLSADKEVVIIGSSFIALEAANYCLNKVKKVTVVFRANAPFKALLGERIGLAFMKLFADKGVHFIPNSGVKAAIDNGSGAVSEVELIDGTRLKADIFIMGVGSEYNTEILKDSGTSSQQGVELMPDGSVEANDYLQTNEPDVYVGGDMAYAPVWSHHNQKAAIGHYPLAHYHGKIAALNILGKNAPLRAVPYFWTMLFGKGVRYAGHGKYNDVVFTGNVEEYKFVAYYLDGDEVVAASSCGMDPVVSQFAELLAQGKKLCRHDLQDDQWRNRIVP